MAMIRFMWFDSKKLALPSKERAIPGRAERMPVPERHFVNGNQLEPTLPGMEEATFGMGCFWGAERKFWELPGVYSTMVGYAGGITENATYREVCTGMTGHAEVVRVIPQTASLFAAIGLPVNLRGLSFANVGTGLPIAANDFTLF